MASQDPGTEKMTSAQKTQMHAYETFQENANNKQTKSGHLCRHH